MFLSILKRSNLFLSQNNCYFMIIVGRRSSIFKIWSLICPTVVKNMRTTFGHFSTKLLFFVGIFYAGCSPINALNVVSTRENPMKWGNPFFFSIRLTYIHLNSEYDYYHLKHILATKGGTYLPCLPIFPIFRLNYYDQNKKQIQTKTLLILIE